MEIRERTVRLVLEHAGEYPSQWAAIRSIAAKCGMTAETLRKWVRRVEVTPISQPGLGRPQVRIIWAQSLATAYRTLSALDAMIAALAFAMRAINVYIVELNQRE